MKTITINLYSFNELSPSSKEKAIDSYRNSYTESFTLQDFWETCKAIEKVFPITIKTLDIQIHGTEFYIHDYPYDEDGNEGTSFGSTFEDYICRSKYPNSNDNMQLTGTYSDIAFLENIPRDVQITIEHLQNAMRELQKYLKQSYEYEFSDKSISETLEAN